MKKTDDKERKLSKAEQKRLLKFEKTKDEMTAEGYEMKEHTLGIAYANVMAFVVAIPFIIPVFALHSLLSEKPGIEIAFYEIALMFVCYILFIVLHEAVHGITWALFAKSHFRSIEFGIMTEMLTPYCTCCEPLKRWQYILGSLMPLFAVGYIPSVAAILLGKFWLFLVGIFMIIGAGGDIIITFRMLRYKTEKQDVVYYDHPTKCGFITFER